MTDEAAPSSPAPDYKRAVDAFDQLMRQYGTPIRDVLVRMRELGGIEEAERQAQARIAAALDEEESVERRLDDFNGQLAIARDDLKAVGTQVVETKNGITAMRQKADVDAAAAKQEILDQAEAEALAVKADAEKQADAIRADAAKEAATIKEGIASETAQRDALQAENAELKKQGDTLRGEIDALADRLNLKRS